MRHRNPWLNLLRYIHGISLIFFHTKYVLVRKHWAFVLTRPKGRKIKLFFLIGILGYSIFIVRRWRNKWKVRRHSPIIAWHFRILLKCYFQTRSSITRLFSTMKDPLSNICSVISLIVLELICLKIKEQLCTITLLQMGQSRGNKTAWLRWHRSAIWTASIFRANFLNVNTRNRFSSYREDIL